MKYLVQLVRDSFLKKPRRFYHRCAAFALMLTALACVLAAPGWTVQLQHNADLQQSLIQPAIGTSDIVLSQVAHDSFSEDALQRGYGQYQAGEINVALDLWQQVAAQSDGPVDRRGIAWTYVAIASQDLGYWTEAEQAINQAISLIDASDSASDLPLVRAQILSVQGRLLLGRGQPEAAWEVWQQAEAMYAQGGDALGEVGAQLNQSQALQTMGRYRRARLQLEAIAVELDNIPDTAIKAAALRSLGTVFQTAGSLTQSEQYLTDSLALFRQIESDGEVAATAFALANTLRLSENYEEAETYYLEAESLSTSQFLQVQAQLNRFSMLLQTARVADARNMASSLLQRVTMLPESRQAVFSRVNFAESLLSPVADDDDILLTQINELSARTVAELLRDAIHQAMELEDARAQALATGTLSKLYSAVGEWSDAQVLARRAIALSQNSHAKDLTYRWQYQLGKTYQHQGNISQAIAGYSDAVDTLQEVRQDLLATNADVQYSFRESVEPIYRDLASLLLLPEEVEQADLSKAREVIEALQLAEMENYFRSACLDSDSELIDTIDVEAAVLYPIVLSDRVEVIASVPGQSLKHYRTWQPATTTNQIINELYRFLNPALPANRRLHLSKQIYDWLITPVESDLVNQHIKTIVFVLDGQFRRIPMAALHDGDRYLIEKYGVALTPGLKLLGPHFQNPKPLQALMLGLTEARNGFSALPGVRTEIEQIASRISTEVLMDSDFTRDRLESEVSQTPFPVLHLATHGQFSSSLDDTFLLAWDERISVGDLDALLRDRRHQAEPIELMVLSACQTAEGDDRAALGLAGVAIRSGARSTIATLWPVNDRSTSALMVELYQELAKGTLSKADALRNAQIKILQEPQYSHPYYWAPFVLIGNWLS